VKNEIPKLDNPNDYTKTSSGSVRVHAAVSCHDCGKGYGGDETRAALCEALDILQDVSCLRSFREKELNQVLIMRLRKVLNGN